MEESRTSSSTWHWVTPEIRRQAELAAPPPEHIRLDRGGRITGDLERCKELPACPPVPGYGLRIDAQVKYTVRWHVMPAWGQLSRGVCRKTGQRDRVSVPNRRRPCLHDRRTTRTKVTSDWTKVARRPRPGIAGHLPRLSGQDHQRGG
jgi:hypothetical protein